MPSTSMDAANALRLRPDEGEQPEIKKEQKNQYRNSPEKPDVNTHGPADGTVSVNLADGHVNTDDQADSHGTDDDADGDQRSLQQVGECFYNDGECIKHLWIVRPSKKRKAQVNPTPSKYGLPSQAVM